MISIVILTCKSANLVPCLESIRKYTDLADTEIIVVCNGYDGQLPDNVKVVFREKMVGYPAACNIGIKVARGEFIVLLNDDTQILGHGWINILKEPFKDKQVAITGPWMMFNTGIQRNFICFFCCMIRRSVLDRIGLLDEIFTPGFGEDVDLSCRAVDAGFRILQVPTPDEVPYDGIMGTGSFPIYHAGGKTIQGRISPDRNHAILRGRFPQRSGKMSVTCGVPTKNRYDTLVLTLQAVAFQARKPDHVIIVDDSDAPVDLRTLAPYQAIFELFNLKGISFQVVYGRKLGQHYSHQLIQDMASTSWIWRVDDDQIPEPSVLHMLLRQAVAGVGAVGGLVLTPNAPEIPPGIVSSINDPNQNVQWFRHPGRRTIEVDHLHSTFLYRRGIEKFNPFLSPAAHREETLFTYGLKRKGYRLLVDTGAVTWHFPGQRGGIRSHTNSQFWADDEKLFQAQLAEWGQNPVKYIVLDAGRGDHVMVKSLLPRIKEKYPKLVMATCYRDIFNGEFEQISIAEAQSRLGNLDRFNVYRWCIDNNWKGHILEAYQKMLEL